MKIINEAFTATTAEELYSLVVSKLQSKDYNTAEDKDDAYVTYLEIWGKEFADCTQTVMVQSFRVGGLSVEINKHFFDEVSGDVFYSVVVE